MWQQLVGAELDCSPKWNKHSLVLPWSPPCSIALLPAHITQLFCLLAFSRHLSLPPKLQLPDKKTTTSN